MKLIDITKGAEHDLCLFSEEKIAEYYCPLNHNYLLPTR